MDRIILFAYIFLQGVHSAHWSNNSLPDGHIIYACLDEGITFSWQYELDGGERVGDVTWYYAGSSQEVMAVVTHGIFVPMATFGQRLSLVGNAGLSVSKLQAGDSGNYSVDVQIISLKGIISTLSRSALVTVSERMMTSDGLLHAVQDPLPVLDPSTGQWSIQLSCGAFLYQNNPPFHVEWRTGDTVVNSSGYSDHHFHLLLPNPVQGGSYTCRIPPQHAADVCLHGNASWAGEVSVVVDQNEARLLLVVKELQQLKEKDQALTEQGQLLQEKLRVEEEKTNNLSAIVSKMESEARQPVAFHATNLANFTYSLNSSLVFTNTLVNVGGGYDSRKGHFTAPVAGVYFFAASVGSQYYFNVKLMANDVVMGTAYAEHTTGWMKATSHCVAHLQRGQRVWLMPYFESASYDLYQGSIFTGFLLSRDV